MSFPQHPLTALSLALCVAVAGDALAQQQALTLHYHERPPYSYTAADGSVQGLVATPIARALARAGIAFAWARTPSQRQLLLIQGGDGLDCSIGWFRTTAREALGKYSREIYRDQPFAALVRADSPLPDGIAARELFADASHPLLVKEGYSYGPVLDALIAAQMTPPRGTTAENVQMVRMIEAGRAGWMIVAPEEAQALLEQAGLAPQSLRLVRLADLPQGQTRHLYCNKAVPDALIEQINRALVAPR